MAFCNNTPTTDESTPPERPSNTLPSPTNSRISWILISMNFSIVHDPCAPQMSKTKLRNMSLP